jgi:hypothetical protein
LHVDYKHSRLKQYHKEGRAWRTETATPALQRTQCGASVNDTRGSLLLVVLFHASQNTVGMFLPNEFAVRGGIVENMLIVLYVLAAVVVTFVAGAERLSRTEEKQTA